MTPDSSRNGCSFAVVSPWSARKAWHSTPESAIERVSACHAVTRRYLNGIGHFRIK